MEIFRETQFPYILFFSDSNSMDSHIATISMFSSMLVQAASNVTISIMEQGFPYQEAPLQIDIGSLLAALTYPLVLSWLLPVYVYNIVLEKQDKLREMMKMVNNYLYRLCIHISSYTRWVLKWGTIGWLPSSMTSSCTLPYWSSFIHWVMLSVLQYSPKEGTYTNTLFYLHRVAHTTLF